ncbi:MAG: methylenetetrahydrofolate--tRNA-(uracil(54)-C(5))-methyltransferase (FADH(2)-oxidizing) TrmFO [Rhizomicrobium sp.]
MAPVLHIVGAGLAGAEAAFAAASRGIDVVLHEMRPTVATEAHRTADFAELVCSNSLRSDDAENNAVGLLHEEMRRAGSLILTLADTHRLPAGGALAVDRDGFAAAVTGVLETHPNIEIRRELVEGLPPQEWGATILATGPLTHSTTAEAIRTLTDEDSLHFFDAIAPVVLKDSINMDVAFFQSRYDKGDGADYINCPMDEAQYTSFIEALIAGEKTEFHEWEKNTPYFEGCLPIEIMAGRGRDTLRFGPMKPVGLMDVRTGMRPHAVVQLRQDNALGSLWNMVGFQTKLKYGEQARIFRLIPGLEQAEFARLGGMHRNTFINSPRLIDEGLRLKVRPDIRFAGQVTGVEGYVESAAIGLLAGLFAVADLTGCDLPTPPETTALGALLHHITVGADAATFQPMNVTFGLLPDPELLPGEKKVRGRDRKRRQSARALADLDGWLATIEP